MTLLYAWTSFGRSGRSHALQRRSSPPSIRGGGTGGVIPWTKTNPKRGSPIPIHPIPSPAASCCHSLFHRALHPAGICTPLFFRRCCHPSNIPYAGVKIQERAEADSPVVHPTLSLVCTCKSLDLRLTYDVSDHKVILTQVCARTNLGAGTSGGRQPLAEVYRAVVPTAPPAWSAPISRTTAHQPSSRE
ncbi:unnamed protein product [Ectocarpus fasciculatus]